MSLKTYQRAFNGGVVSPAMFARIDDGKYQTGLAVCKNFLIRGRSPLVRAFLSSITRRPVRHA